MKNIFFLFLYLLSITCCKAQFSFWPNNKDGVQALKKTILLVEIKVPNEKELKKLTGESKDKYLKRVEAENEVLKKAFPKYWTVQKEFAFHSREEILEMLKKDQEGKYLAFFHGLPASVGTQAPPDLYKYWVNLPNAKDDQYKSVITWMTGFRANTDVDWNFILYNISKYLVAYGEGKKINDKTLYNVDRNCKIIEKKTLLLDEGILNDITKEDAKKSYPHKLEFKDFKDIYSSIERKDSTILFLTYVHNQEHSSWTFAIVDACTMNIIAMQPPNRPPTFKTLGRAFSSTELYLPDSYLQKPWEEWSIRERERLQEGDFMFLGQKKTIELNYSNTLWQKQE